MNFLQLHFWLIFSVHQDPTVKIFKIQPWCCFPLPQSPGARWVAAGAAGRKGCLLARSFGAMKLDLTRLEMVCRELYIHLCLIMFMIYIYVYWCLWYNCVYIYSIYYYIIIYDINKEAANKKMRGSKHDTHRCMISILAMCMSNCKIFRHPPFSTGRPK